MIYVDHLPKGLSGYTLKMKLTSTVAKITKVEFPSWVTLYDVSSLPAYEVKISAVDLNKSVEPGANNVILATLHILGVSEGTFKIELLEYSLDNDEGYPIPIQVDDSFDVMFTIIYLQPFPGCFNPPNDLDEDWLFEDVNGNGRLDFDDVVVLFKNMEWVMDNNYEKYFDFNRNGRLDFDDIVTLFDML